MHPKNKILHTPNNNGWIKLLSKELIANPIPSCLSCMLHPFPLSLPPTLPTLEIPGNSAKIKIEIPDQPSSYHL